MLVDLLVDIAALFEATLAVDKVAVTAGEPGATDKCSAVYVWGIRVYDSEFPLTPRGDDAGCFFRRTYEIGYRIDTCHKVRNDARELTATESLAEAQILYDLGDLAWCTLTAAIVDGTLFDAANQVECGFISVGELRYDSQGDRHSASGTLKVTHPCVYGS